MSKRSREDVQYHADLPPLKRTRNETDLPDRLSSLSSELILHILSFLPVSSLNTCQRLSHRFYSLAGDSELWKRQYYLRWVKPRTRRLRAVLPQRRFKYTPKVSTWLGHGHLAEEGRVTHWKTQYRLKHNWSKGACQLTEVELPEPPLPPFLAKLCSGFMFTVDSAYGLRVWISKNPTSCIASAIFATLSETSRVPTALTAANNPGRNSMEVTVGFQDGHFSVYDFDIENKCLNLRCSHCVSTEGAIMSMACSPPYLLMVSQHNVLSLYEMPDSPEDTDKPRILVTLKAGSIVAPMTLAIRVSASEIISSIVYSFFHIGCGWALGIQELRFGRDGQQIGSRLTTTVDSQYGMRPLRPRSRSRREGASSSEDSGGGGDGGELFTMQAGPCILHRQPPTSMSYSHPYLLTSHADNTLTMYLVVSTAEELFVKYGKRLWGHTSSISAVQVSDRGKAVSVSSYGNEIRVWELETVMSLSRIRESVQDENSIQITPEKKIFKQSMDDDDDGGGDGDSQPVGHVKRVSAAEDRSHEGLDVMRGCVGFDDERVMLFRGKEVGTPWLECYDFT